MKKLLYLSLLLFMSALNAIEIVNNTTRDMKINVINFVNNIKPLISYTLKPQEILVNDNIAAAEIFITNKAQSTDIIHYHFKNYLSTSIEKITFTELSEDKFKVISEQILMPIRERYFDNVF